MWENSKDWLREFDFDIDIIMIGYMISAKII